MLNNLIYYSYIKKIVNKNKTNIKNNVFIFYINNNHLNKNNIKKALNFLFPNLYVKKINSLIEKRKKNKKIIKKKKIYVEFIKNYLITEEH